MILVGGQEVDRGDTFDDLGMYDGSKLTVHSPLGYIEEDDQLLLRKVGEEVYDQVKTGNMIVDDSHIDIPGVKELELRFDETSARRFVSLLGEADEERLSYIVDQMMEDKGSFLDALKRHDESGRSCLDFLEFYQTSIIGLSAGEAEARLAEFGPNIAPTKERSMFHKIVHATSRKVRMYAKLNVKRDQVLKQSKPTRVIRDGTAIELPREQLVVGDLCLLHADEQVPADGIVLGARCHTRNCAYVADQAAVMWCRPGSSKYYEVLPCCGLSDSDSESDSIDWDSNPDRSEFVFQGQMVAKGRLLMLVTATGEHIQPYDGDPRIPRKSSSDPSVGREKWDPRTWPGKNISEDLSLVLEKDLQERCGVVTQKPRCMVDLANVDLMLLAEEFPGAKSFMGSHDYYGEFAFPVHMVTNTQHESEEKFAEEVRQTICEHDKDVTHTQYLTVLLVGFNMQQRMEIGQVCEHDRSVCLVSVASELQSEGTVCTADIGLMQFGHSHVEQLHIAIEMCTKFFKSAPSSANIFASWGF